MSNYSAVPLNAMQNIHYILMRISIPYSIIVSLIGIPGNVLTIILLSKRSLTKNFNNCTLIALASTDLLFNFSLVSRCIIDLALPTSINFCELLAFASHLAELLSACFTVHFTVQRFIAVRFPLSVFIEKNIHLLHYCIVTFFIFMGVSYCFALVKRNGYEDCEEDLRLSWFLSDAILSFVIPFIIIATLNLLIIFRLRKKSRNNRHLSFTKRPKREFVSLNRRKTYFMSLDSSSHSRISENSLGPNIRTPIYQFPSTGETNEHFLSVGHINPRITSVRSTTRYHAQSHRVTRMLILVSTCFLLLNAPSHICSISLELYRLKRPIVRNNNSTFIPMNLLNHSNGTHFEHTDISSSILREYSSRRRVAFLQMYYIILIISKHIAYLSYSINFFLYSFCGMKFRGELRKYLTRYRKYQRQRKKSQIIQRQNSL